MLASVRGGKNNNKQNLTRRFFNGILLLSYTKQLRRDNMETKEQTCKRCNHKWWPRNGKIPVQCPRCKNNKWNEKPKIKSK